MRGSFLLFFLHCSSWYFEKTSEHWQMPAGRFHGDTIKTWPVLVSGIFMRTGVQWLQRGGGPSEVAVAVACYTASCPVCVVRSSSSNMSAAFLGIMRKIMNILRLLSYWFIVGRYLFYQSILFCPSRRCFPKRDQGVVFMLYCILLLQAGRSFNPLWPQTPFYGVQKISCFCKPRTVGFTLNPMGQRQNHLNCSMHSIGKFKYQCQMCTYVWIRACYACTCTV